MMSRWSSFRHNLKLTPVGWTALLGVGGAAVAGSVGTAVSLRKAHKTTKTDGESSRILQYQRNAIVIASVCCGVLLFSAAVLMVRRAPAQKA